MRISRLLKTDKRANAVIRADVLATKVILRYDNIRIKLSHVEARRMADTLGKAVSIQHTHRKDSKPSKPVFLRPETIVNKWYDERTVEQSKKQLTTLERRLELCRYFYQVIKKEFPQLPRYRKSFIVKIDPKYCTIGSNMAHCHNMGFRGDQYRICIKQKFLLQPTTSGFGGDNYDRVAKLMAHEMAHLTVKSCRHCKKFWSVCKKYESFVMNHIKSGEMLIQLPIEYRE